ncbi:hypothetical protein [Bacillus sp. FJAT-49736]|uniref:hypothetical protein n=1 Tax=Bacillus sp. FJAT-49736 TaxID=2833582 RepID=UPI001BC9C9E3|nr:hypothetical protein [Bacillus sp. FJAT-49736]MBS4172615.1 hypothetical protein [Bacillus sp. FJAT-49736]
MLQIYDVAIIPLIIGVVELFKRAGLSKKYSPFIAVILGLLFGIFYVSGSIKEGIIIGLMLGLSASGLYSGTKNMTKGDK